MFKKLSQYFSYSSSAYASGVGMIVSAPVIGSAAASIDEDGDDTKKKDGTDTKKEEKEEEEQVTTDDHQIETLSAEQYIEHEFAHVVGLEEVKHQVNTYLKTAQAMTIWKKKNMSVETMEFHTVLKGNPGTGKTKIAKMLPKILYKCGVIPTQNFFEASRSDLVGEYIGETEKKMKELLQKMGGGVLFIDEAYSLCSGKGSNDYGKIVIESILVHITQNLPPSKKVTFILAGYPQEIHTLLEMNPGLKSRFANEFLFSDYSIAELSQMLVNKATKSGFKIEIQKEEIETILASQFSKSLISKGNARIVDKLFERCRMEVAIRMSSASDTAADVIRKDDIVKAVAHVKKTLS